MFEPRWDDPKLNAGTMVRAALWLLQEVGEGNTFTKAQLRDAFPGVAQADRRVRDLRGFGWVLDTNASDATLSSEEQRFARRGVDVWDADQRRSVDRDAGTISNREREATFAANGYQCVICGIAGGEAYPDRPMETAVLAVSRRTIVRRFKSEEQLLITECKRCRSGAVARTFSVPEVRGLIEDLGPEDRRRIARWATAGVRGTTALDRAWNALRVLPVDERATLMSQVE